MNNQNGLPRHWRTITLGEVCAKASVVKKSEKHPDNEFLYLDIGGIDNKTNKITSHKTYQWKDAPSRAQQIVFKNDVLFSTVRIYLKNIALIESKLYDGQIASSGFTVLRAKSEIAEPRFLFYYSISNQFLQPLNELQTGSSYPAVRDKDVFSQSLPLPPLAEQQWIVAKLEELFSELDAGLASLHAAARQLNTYRQAVLKWAFEGKLTNDHVNEGELSAGWKWVKVSEIAEVRLGRQRSPQKAVGENMCQYLRAANVTWDGLDLSDVKSMDFSPKEQEIYQLQKGDILLSEASGSISEVGKPAIWSGQIPNCCFQNTLIRVRPGDQANSKFLHLRFYFDAKVENFRKIAKGVGIHHLGAAGMSNWSIGLPSLEEQRRIVQEIESRLSVCEKLEETLAAALGQAEALRQSILKQAFAGKLVAPVLNPDGIQA